MSLLTSNQTQSVPNGIPAPGFRFPRVDRNDLPPALSQAFYLALLLTASIEQAESALIEAIELWNQDCESEDALLYKAIAAAVTRPVTESAAAALIEADSLLPLQLRRVLRLPKLIRQCYVLRVLVRLPEPFVAGLLQLAADEVKRNTRLGLERIAELTYNIQRS